MISHVAIMAHGSGARGADHRRRRWRHARGGAQASGACARATMVELDPGVVEIARTYLPGHQSRRVRRSAHRAGLWRWRALRGRRRAAISTSSSSTSTDPFGPGEALFTEAFYADCRARLRPGGILVAQSGNVFVERDRLDACLARLGTVFRDTSFILTAVPAYLGGPFVFAWASTMRPSARFRPRSSRHARCRSTCAAIRRRCTPPLSCIRPG